MVVTDTDKRNRRNSYLRDENIKKILGSIKSVTKNAGPGPKILGPTYSDFILLFEVDVANFPRRSIRLAFEIIPRTFISFISVKESVLIMDTLAIPMDINDDEDISSNTDTWIYDDEDIHLPG
jgi:hypothetical protein